MLIFGVLVKIIPNLYKACQISSRGMRVELNVDYIINSLKCTGEGLWENKTRGNAVGIE
jgi:hypothetical protein